MKEGKKEKIKEKEEIQRGLIQFILPYIFIRRSTKKTDSGIMSGKLKGKTSIKEPNFRSVD